MEDIKSVKLKLTKSLNGGVIGVASFTSSINDEVGITHKEASVFDSVNISESSASVIIEISVKDIKYKELILLRDHITNKLMM